MHELAKYQNTEPNPYKQRNSSPRPYKPDELL